MSEPSELGSLDPREVGPYRLLRRLGSGGQGTVFLGTDGGAEPVAVKVLNTDFHDTGRLKTDLNRELASAQSVAAFVTAGIIAFDLDADPPYIVTEFVDGPDAAGGGAGEVAVRCAAAGSPTWPSRRSSRWRPSTRRTSSTATSSRATSCSARAASR